MMLDKPIEEYTLKEIDRRLMSIDEEAEFRFSIAHEIEDYKHFIGPPRRYTVEYLEFNSSRCKVLSSLTRALTNEYLRRCKDG